MVTEAIKFFIDNVLQKGNIYGLDKRILDVYFGSSIKSDSDSDVILHVDSYSAFGGFLEAFVIWFSGNYKKMNLLEGLQTFFSNIHEHEKLIVARTRWYIDRINTIAEFLRKIYGKVLVAYSELTSGIDLFLLGRSELAKKLLSRKINEWLYLGGEKIVIVDPLEYSFLSTFGATIKSNLKPFLSAIKENEEKISVNPARGIMIYEPFETPILLFPKQMRDDALNSVNSILSYIRSESVDSIQEFLSGPPLCYEQMFLINPPLSIAEISRLLANVKSKVVVTLRVLTALVLRVSMYISNRKLNIVDYAYWLVKSG